MNSNEDHVQEFDLYSRELLVLYIYVATGHIAFIVDKSAVDLFLWLRLVYGGHVSWELKVMAKYISQSLSKKGHEFIEFFLPHTLRCI